MSDDKHWYLVYTKPRQEITAKENLQRQGYEIYLPMTRLPRRRLGKRRYMNEPFFPRYMFIRLNTTSDNWAPIRSTKGVANMVRFSLHPMPVPNELIVNIRSRENPESGMHDIDVSIKKGDKVRVMDGPMMGYEGIFIAKTGQERVIILLDVLGQQARLQIDAEALEVTSS